MMSGIVDSAVTSNTDLSSSPSSDPESDEDELLSSSEAEDDTSDSEFSLEEVDEDRASFA